MKPGERVRIVSHPVMWLWAEEYVGEEEKVLEVNENAARVDLPDGPLWFAYKHLASVDDEKEGAA